VWVTGGLGALLVSLFNMKWRFSAPAGDVEGSKFCLFSVILPAKCVSSISPRFHYRRFTFCFLPLATILEFSLVNKIFSEAYNGHYRWKLFGSLSFLIQVYQHYIKENRSSSQIWSSSICQMQMEVIDKIF
jgi:hypothetical protein